MILDWAGLQKGLKKKTHTKYMQANVNHYYKLIINQMAISFGKADCKQQVINKFYRVFF